MAATSTSAATPPTSTTRLTTGATSAAASTSSTRGATSAATRSTRAWSPARARSPARCGYPCSPQDTEYAEVTNVSSSPVALEGSRVQVYWLSYWFTQPTVLAPGKRLRIYGDDPPAHAA